jgi:hypothetical protein
MADLQCILHTPSLRLPWAIAMGHRFAHRNKILKISIASIVRVVLQTVSLLRFQVYLLKGVCLLYLRQVEILLSDGDRMLSKNGIKTQKKERMSDVTMHSRRSKRHSLYLSGARLSLTGGTFSNPSTEMFRGVAIARNDEIDLLIAKRDSLSFRDSLGEIRPLEFNYFDDPMTLDFSASEFSPMVNIPGLHDFQSPVYIQPTDIKQDFEVPGTLKKKRKRKMHDEVTDIDLRSYRNWSKSTEDIVLPLDIITKKSEPDPDLFHIEEGPFKNLLSQYFDFRWKELDSEEIPEDIPIQPPELFSDKQPQKVINPFEFNDSQVQGVFEHPKEDLMDMMEIHEAGEFIPDILSSADLVSISPIKQDTPQPNKASLEFQERILEQLNSQGFINFEVFMGGSSRLEVAKSFYSLMALARVEMLHVYQSSPFDSIVISKNPY